MRDSLKEDYIIAQLRKVETFVARCCQKFAFSFVQTMLNAGEESDVYRGFRSFLTLCNNQHTLVCLNELKALRNSDVDSTRWSDEACSIFRNCFYKSAKNRTELPFKLSAQITELFPDGLEQGSFVLAESQIGEAKECFQRVEDEVFFLLTDFVLDFTISQQYSSWRSIQRGHVMGLSVQSTLEEDIKIEEDEGPVAATESLLHKIFNFLFATSATVKTPLLKTIDPKPNVRCYLQKGCDPCLGVLVEAIKDLPIGLALHSINHPPGPNSITYSVSSSTSSTSTTFPFVYINKYYAEHCGGYELNEIQGSNYDFMFQPVNADAPPPASSPSNNFSYSSGSSIAALSRSLHLLRTVVAAVPMCEKDANGNVLPGYMNVLAWRPYLAGPRVGDATVEESTKVSSKEETVAKKPFVSLSLPKVHVGNHKVMAASTRKPKQKKVRLEYKFYVCLQVQIPVENMAVGLKAKETREVHSAIDKLQYLIDFVPCMVDPYYYNMFTYE